MPEPAWLPTRADLETIATNTGFKQPEPFDVLNTVAAALRAEAFESTEDAAGLLYQLIMATRPYAEDSWAYALEAARVVLIANGFPFRHTNHERVQALRDDVESGLLAAPSDIGRRLTAL